MDSIDAGQTGLEAAEQARADLVKAVHPRRGERVTIAYPHQDVFGANFVESVLRVIAYDKKHGNYLMHNSGLMNNGALASVWGRSVELAHARNQAAAAFLASESDWLLFWDTDIGTQENAVEMLMDVADPETCPIVGGLCFVEGDFNHDWHGGLQSSLSPTLYDWCWVEPHSGMPGMYKMLARHEWKPNKLTRVAATGTGFLLIHRSALEKIAKWTYTEGGPASIWFERIMGPDGERCGEDISFCMRAHQVGLPVHVHTGVTTTHQKSVWYGVPEYRQKPAAPPPLNLFPLPPDQWPLLQVNPDAARDAAAQSPVRLKQVPEATEEVGIIVPIARRTKAKPFLESLLTSLSPGQTDRVKVYAMCDDSDYEASSVWDYQNVYTGCIVDAHRYLRTMGSFAEKVNRGFSLSDEPWIFLVGDDVKFHPGWLDQAMEVARTTGKQVIGTNDLGTRAVQNGEHATHMFLSRAYVDNFGGGWDGRGIVCHEGYRHWYVDNEIVLAAKERDAWAPCLAAVVEHMHPLFGKGEPDEVYAIGQEANETDRALFTQRYLAGRQKEES